MKFFSVTHSISENFPPNSNIKYVFAVYFLLITDSLIKLEIEFRKPNCECNFLPNILQITFYFLSAFISFYFEFYFKRKTKEIFFKFREIFFSIILIINTVSILEERLNIEIKNEELVFEGCKIMIIHFIFMSSFNEVWMFIFTEFASIVYSAVRLSQNISENIIIIFLLLFVYLIQIKQARKKNQNFKTKEFLNKTSKKNTTTVLKENGLKSSDCFYFLENLSNHASDGFMIFNHKLEALFKNEALSNFFPDSKENLKNEILALQITDLDDNLKKIIQEYKPKKNKFLTLNDIFALKRESNILNSIDFDENGSPDVLITLQKLLELFNKKFDNKTYPYFTTNKLMKLDDFKFKFKNQQYKKSDNCYSGELCVFANKLKKIYLVCFKKELEDIKILENFNKINDYITNELTNSVNCLILILQILQTCPNIQKKLVTDYVNPALISTKFLINLKNEIIDTYDIFKGKIVKKLREFNLNTLTLEILSMFAFQCESKEIVLSLRYDDRIPKNIKSDPRFISQILITLISKYL